jgi:hypothetical protein
MGKDWSVGNGWVWHNSRHNGFASMLHIIRIPLRRGLEAEMVREGNPKSEGCKSLSQGLRRSCPFRSPTGTFS